MPDFPIRGYEYYDYRHDVENVTFRNYEDNATRKTGALSYLMYTSAGVSTENAIERARFVDAKPVFFPPMERRWGNDVVLGNVAWKTAVFHDKDGSVGGVPDAYILINDGVFDSIATDATACEVKPAWNAAVCKGDVGRVVFAAPGGAARPAAVGSSVGGAVPLSGPGTGVPAPAPPPGARRPAAQPPVVLSRNGRTYTTTGASTIRAGTEIKVATERPTFSINVTELDSGSWVIFEMPGFTTAASGTAQGSLDALRKASTTSYYKSKDALWVKVVSDGSTARGINGFGAGGAGVQVSR
jgi:cell migration-inducing and hyaluronan-binding protein